MEDHLPPLLGPDLRLIIVGTEPGRTSLRVGHYYADPNNSFYDDLQKVGLTPRRLAADEDDLLLDFGIGLDDVYGSPTALRHRLEQAMPRSVCFNSKNALARFIGKDPNEIAAGAWQGEKAMLHVAVADITWAVPDSSGLGRRYGPLRRELLARLKRRL